MTIVAFRRTRRSDRIQATTAVADLVLVLTQGEIGDARRAMSKFEWEFRRAETEQESDGAAGPFRHYFVLVGAVEHVTETLRGLRLGDADRSQIRRMLGWHLAQIFAWLQLARDYDLNCRTPKSSHNPFFSSDKSLIGCREKLIAWGYVSDYDICHDRYDQWVSERFAALGAPNPDPSCWLKPPRESTLWEAPPPLLGIHVCTDRRCAHRATDHCSRASTHLTTRPNPDEPKNGQ
ncbi:hypothetical protein [Gordonia malaquae]|uniref:hypothetical protein n=1 Tax=Gordonia malaquae TaxID=410332 RepID=UPI0030FF3897